MKRPEGCQIQQAHNPQMTPFEYRQLLLDGGFRGSKIVHAKPRRNGEDGKERHPYPGRIRQIQLSPIRLFDALATKYCENRQ